MDDFKYLDFDLSDGVATIMFNRPEVYNALNEALTYELQGALKECKKNEDVRVVVLTGNGKAFCSGQDLKEAMANKSRSYLDSLRKRYNPIIKSMRNLPKPIIGKINGVAAGAGCSLALACDYVISSDEAKFIEIFINIGLVPDSGSSYFLPRLVGSAKAFELASMGSRIKGKEAEKLGLINKSVPHDELELETNLIIDYYKKAPTKSIGIIKRMLNKSITSSLDDMLEYEAFCQEIAGKSEDSLEGVTAFIEKREPKFTGK